MRLDNSAYCVAVKRALVRLERAPVGVGDQFRDHHPRVGAGIALAVVDGVLRAVV